MGKKFLSVSEFSKEVGISRQAVYKQVDSGLQKYIKHIDNKIMIDSEAVKIYKEKKTTVNHDNQPVNKDDTLVDFLKKEIEEKNKQIEYLQKSLEQSQKLLEQEQQLHLIDKNNRLKISDTVSADMISVDSNQNEPIGFWNKILNIFK